MEFPERVYTAEEVRQAKELIDKGFKHSRIMVKGTQAFREKVKQALELIKIAGYFDFFRTYIRRIEEIDGLTQLRNAEASIWANRYAVENPVDAASLFIQKASVMKEYLELTHYYSGEAEKRSVGKRIEFLKALKSRSREKNVVEECERLLGLWKEHSSAY
ncbi:MAG: hypothetical protein QXJ02_06010 [Candidatus Bathyarchaeia archaeon]